MRYLKINSILKGYVSLLDGKHFYPFSSNTFLDINVT